MIVRLGLRRFAGIHFESPCPARLREMKKPTQCRFGARAVVGVGLVISNDVAGIPWLMERTAICCADGVKVGSSAGRTLNPVAYLLFCFSTSENQARTHNHKSKREQQ